MLDQLLLDFAGALNRRRAYAATHPMVVAAEERLLASVSQVLVEREVLSISVAKSELLVDGEPFEARGSLARDLATRLHRRGVGSLSFQRGVRITELSAALTWLASERDGTPFAGTRDAGVQITALAYDHLVLDDSAAAAEASVTVLWRTLAVLAEAGLGPGEATFVRVGGRPGATGSDTSDESGNDGDGDHDVTFVDGTLTGVDADRVSSALRRAIGKPGVARKTAAALMELAAQGRQGSKEAREIIARQLSNTLDRLGESSFAPIIRSIGDRARERHFVAEITDVLPVQAVVGWLKVAADSQEQQMSHQLLRVMSKLSGLAVARSDSHIEASVRSAAKELVDDWSLADPNPAEHLELLDRIARFERTTCATVSRMDETEAAIVESTRLVQMALEVDFAGEDTAAAAAALVEHGNVTAMMHWASAAGTTRTATWLHNICTGERAIRAFLLREPVDRLQAREMLALGTPEMADMLIDVLELASTRGTRMIVRQRLAEFGTAILPNLLARLDDAPWYLVRNILTLLQELDVASSSESAHASLLFDFLDHAQLQVRTEALRLLLQHDRTLEPALRHALRDTHERVVLVAIQSVVELTEKGQTLPDAIVTELMALVDARAHDDVLLARAVRALAAVVRPDVRDWLVTLVTKRTRILKRLVLSDPSQIAASALLQLKRCYPRDAVVARVLSLANSVNSDPRWHSRESATERLA